MAEKLRIFQGRYKFPKKSFVHWKSKKLEDNSKNTLKSSHCTATLIHRALECSNDIITFEMLFMFYHLEQKCLHSKNVWKNHTRYTIFMFRRLSFLCFTCYHLYKSLVYSPCMMNVVKMWEGNMQWEIKKKLLRKFRTKMAYFLWNFQA